MIADRLSENRTRLVAVAFAVVAASAIVFAQIRGGGGSSTSRIVSPTVVASWRARESYADGSTTTLLVLWRGNPGWFTAGGRGSGGGGGGSSSSYSYEYMTYGGRTFVMEFDDNKKIVKMVNQEISLKDTNVVLVDFVDSATGSTIVGYRWVDPGPPAPPLVAGGAADPIAGVISRSPELYEYLRCDLKVPDPPDERDNASVLRDDARRADPAARPGASLRSLEAKMPGHTKVQRSNAGTGSTRRKCGPRRLTRTQCGESAMLQR